MTAHPYPQKVVDAVQKQMDWAGATAEVALQALWEADLPSTISVSEVREIWGHAVQAYNGDPEGMHSLRTLLAAHAPEWGNQRSTND